MKTDKEYTEMKEHTFQPQILSRQFNVTAIAQPIFSHRKQTESYSEIYKNKQSTKNHSGKKNFETTVTPRAQKFKIGNDP